MNKYFSLFCLLITLHCVCVFSYDGNSTLPQSLTPPQTQVSPDEIESINNDFEQVKKAEGLYERNTDKYNKQLSRVARIGYQSAAGYALSLTIHYIGKITNTQEYLGFVFPIYTLFLAINLWEAGKAACKMVKLYDKSQEIEREVAFINNRLLREEFDVPQ